MIIKFYLPFPKEFFNKSVRIGPEQPQIIVTNIRGETKRLFKEGYDGAMEICHVTGIDTACGAIIWYKFDIIFKETNKNFWWHQLINVHVAFKTTNKF